MTADAGGIPSPPCHPTPYFYTSFFIPFFFFSFYYFLLSIIFFFLFFLILINQELVLSLQTEHRHQDGRSSCLLLSRVHFCLSLLFLLSLHLPLLSIFLFLFFLLLTLLSRSILHPSQCQRITSSRAEQQSTPSQCPLLPLSSLLCSLLRGGCLTSTSLSLSLHPLLPSFVIQHCNSTRHVFSLLFHFFIYIYLYFIFLIYISCFIFHFILFYDIFYFEKSNSVV